MFVLWSSSNHTPIKYNSPIKESHQITPAYLSHKFVKQMLSLKGGGCDSAEVWRLLPDPEAIQESSDREDAEVVIRGCLGPRRLLE